MKLNSENRDNVGLSRDDEAWALLDSATRKFKTCLGCHVTLPRSEFYAHPGALYGLGPRCKICVRELTRENRMFRERG